VTNIASVNTDGKRCFDLEKINNLNEKDVKKLISTSEKMYYDQIKCLAKTIVKKGIKMVLISGPSGSGKTTSANFLAQELLKKKVGSLVVSIDDFFVNLEDTPLLPNGEPDFENITAVDTDTFNKFYADLLKKGKAKMPRFNFKKHKRDKWENVQISNNEVILVEGLHALNPKMIQSNEFADKICKVFLCVDSVFSVNKQTIVSEQDLRLMRRMYRDFYTRGRTLEETLKLWRPVCEGENLYVAPFKKEANVVIDTIHPYEILVYANYLLEPLSKIKNIETSKLVGILKSLNNLDKKLVPHSSLLWEFLVNKE